MVLARIDERLVLVVPVTTKTKRGGHYVGIVVNGILENVILYQSKIIDVKRLGVFIDEVPPTSLNQVREQYLRFLGRLFRKEN